MATRATPASALIRPLLQRIGQRFGRRKALILRRFARQYYASSASSELARHTDQELYDSVLDAWRFFGERASSEPKILFAHRKLDKDKSRQTVTSLYVLVDDMPFVIDSVRQTLNRSGVIVRNVSNAVFHARRTAGGRGGKGRLKELAARLREGFAAEALSCINCARIPDERCGEIELEIRETLRHVKAAVTDYRPMCRRAVDICDRLLAGAGGPPADDAELKEAVAFIGWLVNDHFTFLGYEKYRIRRLKRGAVMELQRDSLLGVSRLKPQLKTTVSLDSLPKGTTDVILSRDLCGFAKSLSLSRVHRPAHCDYILIKEFNRKGLVATEHRFVGLYTSSVYFREALDIPLVRNKVKALLDRSGFAPNGHSFKDLLQVVNAFPRDELFQATVDQLFATAMEISRIQQIRTCRLFVRRDDYSKFFSCLVYVPRDIYNTRARIAIQEFLRDRLKAEEVEYYTYFSESVLTRIHFILRTPDIQNVSFSTARLEKDLTLLVKPWNDYFLDALRDRYPDGKAETLYRVYANAYSAAYKEAYSAEEGVKDIARIDRVLADRRLSLDLDTCESVPGAQLSFKIFSYRHQLHLSDVAPTLENLGLKIVSEKAFRLQQERREPVWLHDFSLYAARPAGDLDQRLKRDFEEVFRAVWDRRVDDDAFNALVVTAELDWREAALLRAYAAYLKQLKFDYGTAFVAETLARHRNVCRLLLRRFHLLLGPAAADAEAADAARSEILARVDEVANLSEDSALRALLNVIDATQRTNYFQPEADGRPKDYISFKFRSELIHGMPPPKPKFEVFVHSRRMEGIHLRSGRIARGGLRWSDRPEDYRTEVLGLMKAQKVKNAVIVPAGAKGGFVIKERGEGRAERARRGVAGYRTFIRGLLDLTDNVAGGKTVHPESVVCRDGDDPYLVVAADKGTAGFSDIANEAAAERGFWLGDGFASGGSNGYDHKRMGITAKGAWASVRHHFRELGVDVQRESVTVAGIGDMAGDVFGNGMLLSRHVRLVAAFNHEHVFVDPDPDPAASRRERARLFRKSRSSWADYRTELISAGGGVFPRSRKSIAVTPQMKSRLGIDRDALTPDQLVSAILKSPVDLLWNGGIGTFVKATSESHADVGDKANDSVRVDACELRCRVIGEGGNLGLTQLARVEFGLSGGISLTDFIDNSAGVDCSDHEVNIKILLNGLRTRRSLDESSRSALLESMTREVSELVLANNRSQVQSIGMAVAQADIRHREYEDLIEYLERNAGLSREQEFLPGPRQMDQRAAERQFLTRPEICVITSYMKMHLKEELSSADYLDDDYLSPYLYGAFPARLAAEYRKDLRRHPLRREIIAMQLANSLVNVLGPSFVYRMTDTTGASAAKVARLAVIVKDMLRIGDVWREIDALDRKAGPALQVEMKLRLVRTVRQVTRWMLRSRRSRTDFRSEIRFFRTRLDRVRRMIPSRLPANLAGAFSESVERLSGKGVPERLALDVCRHDFMRSATGLIEISDETGEPLRKVVEVYYALGEQLQLNWLEETITRLPVTGHWQALARDACLDDLFRQQQALTGNVARADVDLRSVDGRTAAWAIRHEQAIGRIGGMINRLRAEAQPDYAMVSVALRELQNLAQSTALRAP